MSAMQDKINQIHNQIDPNDTHISDTDFAHWYIVDGELVNIYSPYDYQSIENQGVVFWYIDNQVDPITGETTKVLTNFFLAEEFANADFTPGFWYIKQDVDPITGVVTKELTNPAIVDMTINDDSFGIWYIDSNKNCLTHMGLLDLSEMGSWYLNEGQTDTIISPNVKKIGEWAFSGTSMRSVFLHPECTYYPTSFPEDCAVRYWPISYKVDTWGKSDYVIGEEFDLTDYVILGKLDRSSVGLEAFSYEINHSRLTVKTFDNTTPGVKTVVLKYETNDKTEYDTDRYLIELWPIRVTES